ncbi:MAG TPA: hypothetical protein VK508_16405 [Cyclobacteriaceae bacterium]|nr:hypothetical protein [Cyclobacteriaceae bacterium]
MRSLRLAFFATLLFASIHVDAQLANDMDDESKLYAQTKQVNQFFRRFNGEESEKGDRYNPGDRQYRNVRLRKKYLAMLFDEGNRGFSNDLKVQFAKDVLDKSEPGVLDFHGPGWVAEVQTTFTVSGKDLPVTLYMQLEPDHLGYKWTINKVYSDGFSTYFKRDTTKVGQFLHPMSHELDFMNLRKAFMNVDSVAQFASKNFVPDYLTLFLYEVKRGNMKFKFVDDVKFHFFQINGWYFELADFNRPGYNTGWLISNLVKINNDRDKEALRKFIYHENP